MKKIKLTKGYSVLVDDEDYDYLNQWKWCVNSSGKYRYAIRNHHYNKKNHYIYMHRLIMSTLKGMEVDHIDHNTLNCQKHNMRNCTHAQNAMNQASHGKVKYLGVSYDSYNNIRAFIKKGTIHKNLGIFKTEIEAALAYDKKAIELFGEFANLNIK